MLVLNPGSHKNYILKLSYWIISECEDTPKTSVGGSPLQPDVAPPQDGVLEQPPSQTPRTPGQGGLPQDGVLEQPPTQGVAPPTRGQGVLPLDEEVLQQPTDEGAAPRIVEPPPPTCAPGSVLDPDINECVLENPPELYPDGSIPQPTGPSGTQPECPSFEADSLEQGQWRKKNKRNLLLKKNSSSLKRVTVHHHQKMIATTTTTRLVCQFTNLLSAVNGQLR